MTTPRKYPTLTEFTELKAAVDRIEQKLGRPATRPSIYVDPVEVGARIGIVDSNGSPITVGDYIMSVDKSRSMPVTNISLRTAGRNGVSLVVYVKDDDIGQLQEVTVVDGQLLNHVLCAPKRKATT